MGLDGPAAAGAARSHHYSAVLPSVQNKAYVEAFGKAKGDSNGEKLLAAMKGMAWSSVRGPVSIDAVTRDIVQTVYICKAEASGGVYYNVEFEQVEKVRDPGV